MPTPQPFQGRHRGAWYPSHRPPNVGGQGIHGTEPRHRQGRTGQPDDPRSPCEHESRSRNLRERSRRALTGVMLARPSDHYLTPGPRWEQGRAGTALDGYRVNIVVTIKPALLAWQTTRVEGAGLSSACTSAWPCSTTDCQWSTGAWSLESDTGGDDEHPATDQILASAGRPSMVDVTPAG